MITDTFIVLLHGLGATPHTLLGVEKYLNWHGYHRTHKINYNTCKLSLEECIDTVSQKLEKVVSKDEEIIVIGQSMGGVVGNQLHTRGWKIDLLITIGSPLKGASVVKTLKENMPQKVQDILHKPLYEDLIKLLEEPMESPPHKYHCFTMAWPLMNFDGCVYVEEGKFEDEHHTHLPNSDHRTIFANPRLWWHVHKVIEDKIE
jgi:pimeloyl-ACP methyl ester carboxylesterase